jgi:hypothetical protein
VNDRKKLLILLPGKYQEALALVFLVSELSQTGKYFIELRDARSNNIYIARHVLALDAEKMNPDYVLWIDSDNLVDIATVESLIAQMEAYPSVSILGAWYRFVNAKGHVVVAAGGLPASLKTLVTEEQIAEATTLMEVGFIGLGCCLMRGQVFQDTAPEHFRPILDPNSEFGFMTDDAGFCKLARDRGHKTYLHPFIRVEHLKTQCVPAPAGLKKEKEENGNHSNTSGDGSELQKLEHHMP